MIEPISPAEVSALVAMIGRTRRRETGAKGWPTKGDLVAMIGAVEGGDWFTSAELADLVGMGEGTCRRLLNQLEAERVILRDGGAGGRRFWCEVNPEWRQWRVPWRAPVRIVAQRLAYIRERATTPALMRFLARPMHARYPEISARVSARDKALREAAEAALARELRARDNAIEPDTDRASKRARSGSGYRASHTRAVNRHRPEEEERPTRARSSRDVDHTPPQSPDAPPEVDLAQFVRARKAVFSRCLPANGSNAPFLRGGPENDLKRLLAHVGLDELLVAIDKVEAGVHQPPRFVQHLADVVFAGPQMPLELAGIQTAGETGMSVLGKLERVRQEIANYRGLDVDPPDDLLAEEARYLAALGGEP